MSNTRRKANPALLADFYKLSHRELYPEGTEYVYSTWTPRGNRIQYVTGVVSFGLQAFIKGYLQDYFDENFFNLPKEEVIADYVRIVKHTLGGDPQTKHLEDLHDLGYLPLSIKALPEGTITPFRVPTITIQNTDPRFFWLTNYIETLMSCELWQAETSATIANAYRKYFDTKAMETVGNTDTVPFMAHDFSMRGMSSLESATLSGMSHLLSFQGTDTLPAILGLERFYGADVTKELVGTSIPATEHSIQCAFGDDMEYLRNTLTKVHPNGFCSIVSDGYDLWDVIGRVIPALKDEINARDGRAVIRPDSGDPVLIVAGDPNGKTEIERKGVVEALWDIFGGTETEKGYKLLSSKVGVIYGDSITFERAVRITESLQAKGFAFGNCVFGIGSYTYNYVSRDSLGNALKSTLCVVNGEERQIYKNPKTDDGLKKSQKGMVAVVKDGDTFAFIDHLGLSDKIKGDQLVEVYRDGKLLVEQSLSEIRARLAEGRKTMLIPVISLVIPPAE